MLKKKHNLEQQLIRYDDIISDKVRYIGDK